MKAASISQLKQELKNRSSNELLEIGLRLARFKKKTRNYLPTCFFEAQDEQAYIESISTLHEDLQYDYGVELKPLL